VQLPVGYRLWAFSNALVDVEKADVAARTRLLVEHIVLGNFEVGMGARSSLDLYTFATPFSIQRDMLDLHLFKRYLVRFAFSPQGLVPPEYPLGSKVPSASMSTRARFIVRVVSPVAEDTDFSPRPSWVFTDVLGPYSTIKTVRLGNLTH
jgi:hypothetical protein